MNAPAVHPLLPTILRHETSAALVPSPEDAQGWDDLIASAAHQGLTLLLWRRIGQSDLSRRIPPVVLERLKAEAVHLASRNLLLADELGGILRAFETRQVPCIPIRGPALAEQLYGELTARPMGDLDLLVKQENLSEVGEILRGLGFTELDRRPGFARTFSYTLEFFKDRHGWVIVEPHWTIAYPPFTDRVKMEPVWDRCVKGRVVGIETRLLSSEDLFLHLCFHLIHRGEAAPLLWFYELDCLLRQGHGTLDWLQILESVVRTGQETLLTTILERLTRLFDSPIPDQAVFELKSRPMSRPGNASAGKLERRLTRMLAGDSRVDGLESFALLFAIKGMRRKLCYALALAFPSAEFMRLEYGCHDQRWLGLCYLTRLWFLLREGLRGIAGLCAISRRP